MWENQSGKFTTPKKVNIYFLLPEFSATKILTWKFHMDELNNSKYHMILSIDLLTALILDLKISNNVIIGV